MVQDHERHGERAHTVKLWKALRRSSAAHEGRSLKKVAPTMSSTSTFRHRFYTRAHWDVPSFYRLSLN
jgi:hypothetical protein